MWTLCPALTPHTEGIRLPNRMPAIPIHKPV
jgi:hypothetical protein